MFMTISAALNHYLQDVYISHLFVGMKTVHLKIDRRILVTSVVSKPGFFITKLSNKYSKST